MLIPPVIRTVIRRVARSMTEMSESFFRGGARSSSVQYAILVLSGDQLGWIVRTFAGVMCSRPVPSGLMSEIDSSLSCDVGEGDLFAVGRPRRVFVIGVVVRYLDGAGAVDVHHEELLAALKHDLVNKPLAVRRRRRIVLDRMRELICLAHRRSLAAHDRCSHCNYGDKMTTSLMEAFIKQCAWFTL